MPAAESSRASAPAASAASTSIAAVVFDIGGVLLDWSPDHFYRGLIPDDELREWFLTEVCSPEWNATLDAGRSFDDACDELAARHPDHAHLVHAWKRQDEMVLGEVPGTGDVVRALKASGVPLYLLTNMPADVFVRRRERFDILREFTGAVVSGEEGVLKPSREIFGRVATRFELDPARTLFIDDALVNVEGARAAGFQAHHFTNAASLRDALALAFPFAFGG
jgi:2-haloacid dehalogenase